MAPPAVVPMTINSPLAPNYLTGIQIGQQSFGPNAGDAAGYWIVVVDRTSLEVVYNQLQTSYDAAPNLGSYNTSGYFMIVAGVGASINTVPQGDFYDFLVANGAGGQLARIEQISEQIGCGSVSNFGYVLVSVLGLGPNPPTGIEDSTVDNTNLQGVIVTASLIGTVVNGTTIYSPVIVQ